MEPRSYAALFTVVAVVFAFIYATYTVPAQVALGAVPYFADTRVWIACLAYGGIAAVAALLMLLAYRASKPLVGAGRRVMEYFALALAFYMLGAAATSAGLASFISLGTSFSLAAWNGLVYPCCIPVAMMFAGMAPYFMLKFSYWMAKQKEPGAVREISVLAPLALLLLLATSPLNWFGSYPPVLSLPDMQLKVYVLGIPYALLGVPYSPLYVGVEVYPDVRLFSNGLLLLVNLAAITQIIVFLHRKAVKEEDRIRAARLRTVLLGFLAMLGFFACYTLDALVGGGFTIPLFAGFAASIAALTLLYIGAAAPEWYTSRIQRKVKGE